MHVFCATKVNTFQSWLDGRCIPADILTGLLRSESVHLLDFIKILRDLKRLQRFRFLEGVWGYPMLAVALPVGVLLGFLITQVFSLQGEDIGWAMIASFMLASVVGLGLIVWRSEKRARIGRVFDSVYDRLRNLEECLGCGIEDFSHTDLKRRAESHLTELAKEVHRINRKAETDPLLIADSKKRQKLQQDRADAFNRAYALFERAGIISGPYDPIYKRAERELDSEE